MSGMHAPAPFVLEVLTTAIGLAGLLASDLPCFKFIICKLISCQGVHPHLQGLLVPTGIAAPVEKCVRYCQSSEEGVLVRGITEKCHL